MAAATRGNQRVWTLSKLRLKTYLKQPCFHQQRTEMFPLNAAAAGVERKSESPTELKCPRTLQLFWHRSQLLLFLSSCVSANMGGIYLLGGKNPLILGKLWSSKGDASGGWGWQWCKTPDFHASSTSNILPVMPSSVLCLGSWVELSMQDKGDVMWMRRPKFNLRRRAGRSITWMRTHRGKHNIWPTALQVPRLLC